MQWLMTHLLLKRTPLIPSRLVANKNLEAVDNQVKMEHSFIKALAPKLLKSRACRSLTLGNKFSQICDEPHGRQGR